MNDELIKALEVIKAECLKHKFCGLDCPLCNANYEFCETDVECIVTDVIPAEYNIKAMRKEKTNEKP